MGLLNLGNDPTLNPDGIDCSAEMVDQGIEAQATTDFQVTCTNRSNTDVPQYQVFVNRTVGAINLSPNVLTIPRLDAGETETLHFLAHNPTNAQQNTYTIRVRSSYFGGVITHNYDDYVRP